MKLYKENIFYFLECLVAAEETYLNLNSKTKIDYLEEMDFILQLGRMHGRYKSYLDVLHTLGFDIIFRQGMVDYEETKRNILLAFGEKFDA